MWTEKTPAEIQADIAAMFRSLDADFRRGEEAFRQLGDAIDAVLGQPVTILMRHTAWCELRALQTFGQRVNRANRHKFRRHYLRALQGA